MVNILTGSYNQLELWVGQAVVSSTTLTECNAVLIGSLWFPGSSLRYWLTNNGSGAVQVSTTPVKFVPPNFGLTTYPYDTISVNPGQTSFARVQVYYNASGGSPVILNLVDRDSSQLSVEAVGSTAAVAPGEQTSVFLEISGTSGLSIGNTLSIGVNISENCSTSVSSTVLPVTVYNTVVINTANKSVSSILLHWTPLPMVTMGYRLHIDFANGTDYFASVSSSVTELMVSNLKPYQPVYVTITALGSSGNIVARRGAIQFRSAEAG